MLLLVICSYAWKLHGGGGGVGGRSACLRLYQLLPQQGLPSTFLPDDLSTQFYILLFPSKSCINILDTLTYSKPEDSIVDHSQDHTDSYLRQMRHWHQPGDVCLCFLPCCCAEMVCVTGRSVASLYLNLSDSPSLPLSLLVSETLFPGTTFQNKFACRTLS